MDLMGLCCSTPWIDDRTWDRFATAKEARPPASLKLASFACMSASCSTCGGRSQWMRSATWIATEPGIVTLAVGAARAGYGTPAVAVGIANVTIIDADTCDDSLRICDAQLSQPALPCDADL